MTIASELYQKKVIPFRYERRALRMVHIGSDFKYTEQYVTFYGLRLSMVIGLKKEYRWNWRYPFKSGFVSRASDKKTGSTRCLDFGPSSQALYVIQTTTNATRP